MIKYCLLKSHLILLFILISSCGKDYFEDIPSSELTGQTHLDFVSDEFKNHKRNSHGTSQEACDKTFKFMKRMGIESPPNYNDDYCKGKSTTRNKDEGNGNFSLKLLNSVDFKQRVENSILDEYSSTQCHQITGIEDTGYFVVTEDNKEGFQKELENGKEANENSNPKIYILTYTTLEDSKDIERKAFLSVPQKRKDLLISSYSYPVILYAHAQDSGLKYEEISSALSVLQLSHIVAAPSFTGQEISIGEEIHIEKTTKKDWLDGDANELLALQSCLSKLSSHIEKGSSQDTDEKETSQSDLFKSITIEKKAKEIFTYQLSEKANLRRSKFLTHNANKPSLEKLDEAFAFAPRTFLVGTDTGATIGLLSLIRDGVFLKNGKNGHYISLMRADFPLTSIFSDELSSLLISGSFGEIQNSHYTIFTGAENFNSIFEPYRLSSEESHESELEKLTLKLARMDVLFLLENLKYSLRSWSHLRDENNYYSKGALLVTANIEDRMFSYKNSEMLERYLDRHFKDKISKESLDYSVFFFQPDKKYYTQLKTDNPLIYFPYRENKDQYFEMDIVSDRHNLQIAHGDESYLKSHLILRDIEKQSQTGSQPVCEITEDFFESKNPESPCTSIQIQKSNFYSAKKTFIYYFNNTELNNNLIKFFDAITPFSFDIASLLQENLYPDETEKTKKDMKKKALELTYRFFNKRLLFGFNRPFDNIDFRSCKSLSFLNETSIDDFFSSDKQGRKLTQSSLSQDDKNKVKENINEASFLQGSVKEINSRNISPLDIITMWTISSEAQLFDYFSLELIAAQLLLSNNEYMPNDEDIMKNLCQENSKKD